MISTLENNLTGKKATIATFEPLAAAYDAECIQLGKKLAELEKDLEAVKQKHLPGLKRQAAVVANRQAELYSAVEQSPESFAKPRTMTMHGTKFGLTTSKGKLEWTSEEQVVARVRRLFRNRFNEFVKTEYSPKKDALRALSVDDLAKLGCRIDGAGDVVLLERVDSDVAKLITKLTEKIVAAMVGKED